MSKTEWIDIARRGAHYPVFMWDSINIAWARKNLSKSVGIDFDFRYYKRANNCSTFEKNEWNKFVEKLREVLENNRELLIEAGKKDLGYLQQMVEFSKKVVERDLTKLSKQELVELIKEFNEIYIKKAAHWYINIGLQRFLPDQIAEALEKKLKQKGIQGKFNDYFSVLISPCKELLLKKAKKALLELAIKVKLKCLENCKEELEAYIKEFGFLNGIYYNVKELTPEEVIEKINNIENPKEESDKIREKEKQEKEDSKILFGNFGFSQEMLEKINLARFYSYVANYMDERILQAHLNMRKVFTGLGKRFGLTYEQITECTVEELYSLNIPSIEVLDERAKDYAYIMEDLNVKIYTGKELEKLEKEKDEDYSHISEIKGTCGCMGYAKGRVKIINNTKELSKVEKGDILVAYSTNVECVPAMERAAAIVTNEGGITCHAAIVAREMSKPCLIGTKIATKVLKDDDMVEVDATKGIVRKVK